MSTIVAPRPAVNVKPIQVADATLDPWYADKPNYDVPVASLVFGARVYHRVLPGTWKIVRAAERLDSTRRYHVRVREIARNGSLVGPVLSWTIAEVAELVTDEPKAEPAPAPVQAELPAPVAGNLSEISDTPPATESQARPLVVAMVISIDGTHYAVAPLAPAPAATKAFRFSKVDGDEARHDLDEGPHGASCTCGDFVWRHEGRDALGCKHIRAARMLGLIAEAPEDGRVADHVRDEFDEPPVPASHRPRHEAARTYPALHGFALAEAAVKEGRALWIDSRPTDAGPDDDARAAYDDAREAEARAANPARDIVLLDDDGTPLETPAEMDARHRSEHMARVRELMAGNPFLPACCPDDEPAPCSTCLVHEGPADLSDDGWDDSHVWAPCDFTPDPDPAAPTRLAFAAWVAYQGAEHAKIGGERHAWLAAKIARLAEQARHLDASTPEAFEDRLQAQLDAAAARIEARHAAARCG